MSRSATSTLRTMVARRGAMSALSGSSSAAMRMRASGLRRSCDTPASSSDRSLSWCASRAASATQAVSMATISSVGSPSSAVLAAGAVSASCDSMRRRKASSGRVKRRASAQLAAPTTARPSASATNRRRKT